MYISDHFPSYLVVLPRKAPLAEEHWVSPLILHYLPTITNPVLPLQPLDSQSHVGRNYSRENLKRSTTTDENDHVGTLLSIHKKYSAWFSFFTLRFYYHLSIQFLRSFSSLSLAVAFLCTRAMLEQSLYVLQCYQTSLDRKGKSSEQKESLKSKRFSFASDAISWWLKIVLSNSINSLLPTLVRYP